MQSITTGCDLTAYAFYVVATAGKMEIKPSLIWRSEELILFVICF